jgi:hypothetical protein
MAVCAAPPRSKRAGSVFASGTGAAPDSPPSRASTRLRRGARSMGRGRGRWSPPTLCLPNASSAPPGFPQDRRLPAQRMGAARHLRARDRPRRPWPNGGLRLGRAVVQEGSVPVEARHRRRLVGRPRDGWCPRFWSRSRSMTGRESGGSGFTSPIPRPPSTPRRPWRPESATALF